MRILLTGAAGFIGSHTANLLEEHNHKVLAVDDFSTGKTENLKGFMGIIQPGDVSDFGMMEKIFSEFFPQAVIHLAAQSAITTAFSDPQKDLRVNGIGTINLLRLSRDYGVEQFVFSSTSAVYREEHSFFRTRETNELSPSTPYGISKLAAEQYIRLLFPHAAILRYGNVYGPRQVPIGENQVIARAFRNFLHGDDFKVTGDGRQTRDFVYVGDIANCNVLAAECGINGTFNASSGKSHSVNEVLGEIEKIYEVPGYRWEHTKENDPRRNVKLDVSRIRREMGWRTYTGLSEGLRLTSVWWEGRNDPCVH